MRAAFDWFPAEKICVHKHFQPMLFEAFRQLEHLSLHREIKTFDDAYGIRFISGSTAILSIHSWGAAIDMNAEENPLGSAGTWKHRVHKRHDAI